MRQITGRVTHSCGHPGTNLLPRNWGKPVNWPCAKCELKANGKLSTDELTDMLLSGAIKIKMTQCIRINDGTPYTDLDLSTDSPQWHDYYEIFKALGRQLHTSFPIPQKDGSIDITDHWIAAAKPLVEKQKAAAAAEEENKRQKIAEAKASGEPVPYTTEIEEVEEQDNNTNIVCTFIDGDGNLWVERIRTY